jgi:hypothetical protein
VESFSKDLRAIAGRAFSSAFRGYVALHGDNGEEA